MYRAIPLSRKKIRGIANFVRDTFHVDKYYLPILKIIEIELSKLDENFVLEVVPDDDYSELDIDVYAQAYPEDKKIVVRQSVYNDSKNDDGRARFTFAHELFHYLFHGSENIEFCRSKNDIPSYSDPEWQANTFAAELLMPAKMFENFTDRDISILCKTSIQATRIQRENYYK